MTVSVVWIREEEKHSTSVQAKGKRKTRESERERKESADIDQWDSRIRARAFPLAASVLGGGRRKKIDDDAEIYHYARLCTDSDGEIK